MSDRELRLVLPDWEAMDTVAARRDPFALWTVGDQPLLAHWLDHAVNEEFSRVICYVADRPAEVRRWLAEATLWPIERIVQPIPREGEAPAEAQRVVNLPGLPPPQDLPTDGWQLLGYWRALEDQWLAAAFANLQVPGVNLAIGRDCQISPDAKLVEPYFLGDGVQVGPGSIVGPYAMVGAGTVLAGGNVVTRARIQPQTFLGAQTGLEDAILEGAKLWSLRHRTELNLTEGFLARSLASSPTPEAQVPGLGERWRAWWLWLRWPQMSAADLKTETTLGGPALPLLQGASPDWLAARRSWLPLVWQGRLRLYGVLPRTEEQLRGLPSGWADLLRSAPVGVFSYADLHDEHRAGTEAETLHAVYQAIQPAALWRPAVAEGLRQALASAKRLKSTPDSAQ